MSRFVVRAGASLADDPDGARAAARRAVAGAQLVGPDQEVVRRRVLDAIEDQADVLVRTDRPGHLTGSALVVDPVDGRVLVVFHRKLQRWLQPGGHADGDGVLARVAWREATEETGIDGLRVVTPAVHLDVHEVRPPAEDAHLHLDLRYVVLAPPGALAVGNHESEAVRWVAPTELPALGADDGLLALADRAAAVLAELADGEVSRGR